MSNELLKQKVEFHSPAAVELTDQQHRALAFLRSYVAANDNMPTAKTVSEHFGWTSVNAGYDVLVRLAKKGYIERLAGQVGWRFVRTAAGATQQGGTACQ
jgi:SOS-response transcriptional repressor LexA